MDIIEVLNEIKNREYSLRDIVYNNAEPGSRFAQMSGTDCSEIGVHDFVVGFMICLKFSGKVDFSKAFDNEHIYAEIDASTDANVRELADLWKNICNKYPYIFQLWEILSDYNIERNTLSDYNWQKVIRFLLSNYLCRQNVGDTRVGDEESVACCKIIYNNRKVLDISLSGRVLVKSCTLHLAEYLLCECRQDEKYCFMDPVQGVINVIRISNALLGTDFKHVDSDCVVEDGIYDAVISNFGNTNEVGNMPNIVKKNGTYVVFSDRANNKITDLQDTDTPLIVKLGRVTAFVCRNIKDDVMTSCLRFGYMNLCYLEDIDSVIRTFGAYLQGEHKHIDVSCAATCLYQKLTRFDAIHSNLELDKIFRKNEELDFEWKKISDIVKDVDSGALINNTDIDTDKIIGFKSNLYSKTPFDIELGDSYNIDGYKYKQLFDIHVAEECDLKSIPRKYEKLFDEAFNSESPSRQAVEFEIALTCRLLDHTSLLSIGTNIVRVRATKDSPIIYRRYTFVDSSYGFGDTLHEVEIKEGFDEDFVIYQIHQSAVGEQYILVPPTKEEQHAYFLKNRDEYLKRHTRESESIAEFIEKDIKTTDLDRIAFMNFRKFNYYSGIDFGRINFFVGGNNSGKSTTVKALLLALDNIKNFKYKPSTNGQGYFVFRFDANEYHDVNINTFERAHYRKDKSNIITFSLFIGEFGIDLFVQGDESNKNAMSAPISKIIISDERHGAWYTFDYHAKVASMKIRTASDCEITCDMPIIDLQNSANENGLVAAIRMFANYTISNKGSEYANKLEKWTGLIHNSADRLLATLQKTTLEYIYAHSATQEVLYSKADKNNYMAKTIHEFFREQISPLDEEFQLITRWMEILGIGKTFKIESLGGEAYTVTICEEDGTIGNLADKGMGGIQLMILLMRLAIIIRTDIKNKMSTIVLLEEPEQNLHPAFQSKLSMLFYEINKKYGIRFIVETHSEYMIRSSQVIVAKKQFCDDEVLRKENPFKVYYFPTIEEPYQMQYRRDGNFSNEFGKGFFDEANNLLFEIL